MINVKDKNRKLTNEEMEGWKEVYYEETHPQLLKPPHGEKTEHSAKKPNKGTPPEEFKGWADFLPHSRKGSKK